MNFTCVRCNKTFVSRDPFRKYCSRECFWKSRHPHTQEIKDKIRRSNLGKTRSAETCKRVSESHMGLIPWNKGKKLSTEHRINISKSRIGMVLSKSHCEHIRIGLLNGKPRIFSKKMLEKMRLDNTGDKNPYWRGGITPLLIQIRQSPRMVEWRKQVFRRDEYKDFYSGCKGNVVAHHVISFKSLIKKYNITTLEQSQACEGLWDVNNGITMLKASHVFYHSIWGK